MAIGKRTCVALTAQYAVGVEKGGIFVTKYVALAAAKGSPAKTWAPVKSPFSAAAFSSARPVATAMG